ncbi:hypothetical protein SLEP1_g37355 [Rubroshorea leprosula]|uniref:Ribosomal protein L10e/L16 domain-containing protein n=1 Tax=Rubroshorea leprosula TaxID=152421 RepID=A0AAV5KUJ7_9ROSI|nr:hypothetical protein SLEP1_g37355 [Rubroshorea leprosula]
MEDLGFSVEGAIRNCVEKESPNQELPLFPFTTCRDDDLTLGSGSIIGSWFVGGLVRVNAESRPAGGKGSPKYWVAVVKPGRILYEMDGVAEKLARRAISIAASKMPIKIPGLLFTHMGQYTAFFCP